jgi:glycine cleavage system H protein
MTALLVILTFVLFVVLDVVITRVRQPKEAARPVRAAAPALAPAVAAPEPVWVAGYELPEALHYHRGHTWARVDGPDVVTVGIDDFARRLTGDVGRVRLPAVGSWLRQGAEAAELGVNGRSAEVLAPVEGEVIAVNSKLRSEPGLTGHDPYGRGWLFKVRSGSLAANLRNLLNGNLARRWMQESREQLELRLMALSGTVLQDGGEPAPDFAKSLEDEDWQSLVGTFLLTGRKAV